MASTRARSHHALPDGFADKAIRLAGKIDDITDRTSMSITRRESIEFRGVAEQLRMLARFPNS